MSSIDKIKFHVKDELKQFDDYFNKVMKTRVPLLNLVMNYLLRRKGKQMRPLLVFLSAKLHGMPTDSTFTAAALIEILHTATLIHDDVVDNSNERRGFFSINALWKSKVAVLVGDYLLAKGLLLAVEKKEYELLNLVANAVKEMSEGELLQIKNSRKLKISESEYFEIIRKKTATLLACCSASGAKSVGCSVETVEKMQNFGEFLGIAFQIKDDLLDYQSNSSTGKPAGNDIQEKKLTLPLIHALERSNTTERIRILRILNNSDNSSKKFKEVLAFINKYDGIDYAEDQMNNYILQASKSISDYNGSPMHEALESFVDYVVKRNK
jgi:octaprenyl-diphosphate synthase